MLCGRGNLCVVAVSGGQQVEEKIRGVVRWACIIEEDNTDLPQVAEVALEVEEVGWKEKR
jgi:hypothetical protein